MASYANQYVIVDEVGVLDERKSLLAMQKNYDVDSAPPGKLSDFLTRMVRLRAPQWHFEQILARYKEELLHASEVQFLAQHGAPTPLAFKEKFGEAFVQHFVDNVRCDGDLKAMAAFMLEFSESGQDWLDLNGYDCFGVRILDLMRATVEEFEEAAEDEAEEKIEEAEERAQSVTFTASADDLWAIAQLQMGEIEITLSQAQLKRLRSTY